MSITFARGFRAAAATAGLKPSGKPDLALIVRDEHSPHAGFAAVFTSNQVVGAPVLVGRDIRTRVLHGKIAAPRAILVNAGNSNAATGEPGVRDAQACMTMVADGLGCTRDAVLPCSTGVIGRPLAVEKIREQVQGLVRGLATGDEADAAAMRAIMTTDLVPKHARREITLSTGTVRIGAIGKGSGMIAPRLDSAHAPPTPSATMLGFITTDAAIASADLQHALERASGESFNRISVDNHPSCSDTAICLSSGMHEQKPGHSPTLIRRDTADFDIFTHALSAVCRDLAEQVVTDGEGATRVFVIRVVGATSDRAAELMAREVVNSPLVKCAIHGRDPNWGRIVTAAGNAGQPMDLDHASLTIGPVEVYRGGVPVVAALSDARLKEAMGGTKVELRLTVGRGPGQSWMMGCDLSKDYVSINADYTT